MHISKSVSMAERARNFALEKHGLQKYGNRPYSVHLDMVAKAVIEYLPVNCPFHIDGALTLAYLHDVLEDTETTEMEIDTYFGRVILDNLKALSDDKYGENRYERKRRSWQMLRRYPMAKYVKIADRLANTQFSIKLLAMYRKEYPLFEAALWEEGEFTKIWNALRDATERDESELRN